MKAINLLYLTIVCLILIRLAACRDKTHAETTPASCCSSINKAAEGGAFSYPEMSVYHLDGHWQDQNGNTHELKDFAGKPVILTMFFTYCEYACPLLIHDMKSIETLLDNEKHEYTYVLVSFDHRRDTPERLKTYADSQGVGEKWMFLHGNSGQIKALSVMLGINYEELENGQFAHSNRKLVLDKEGVVVFQQDGLQTKAEPVVLEMKRIQ